MKFSKAGLIAMAVGSFSMSAFADVQAIGEFSGDAAEGFEAIEPPGGYPGPMPLFGGNATMNDTITNFNVIAFSWSGPAGDVLPYNGNLMGGTIVGSSLFTFNTPVTKFGGFFTTVGLLSGGTAIFRDAAGSEVGSLAMSVQPLNWTWQGWESTTPIASIELVGPNVPGIALQADDLQVTYAVPAPGALVIVAGAGLVSLRRRR